MIHQTSPFPKTKPPFPRRPDHRRRAWRDAGAHHRPRDTKTPRKVGRGPTEAPLEQWISAIKWDKMGI